MIRLELRYIICRFRPILEVEYCMSRVFFQFEGNGMSCLLLQPVLFTFFIPLPTHLRHDLRAIVALVFKRLLWSSPLQVLFCRHLFLPIILVVRRNHTLGLTRPHFRPATAKPCNWWITSPEDLTSCPCLMHCFPPFLHPVTCIIPFYALSKCPALAVDSFWLKTHDSPCRFDVDWRNSRIITTFFTTHRQPKSRTTTW